MNKYLYIFLCYFVITGFHNICEAQTALWGVWHYEDSINNVIVNISIGDTVTRPTAWKYVPYYIDYQLIRNGDTICDFDTLNTPFTYKSHTCATCQVNLVDENKRFYKSDNIYRFTYYDKLYHKQTTDLNRLTIIADTLLWFINEDEGEYFDNESNDFDKFTLPKQMKLIRLK